MNGDLLKILQSIGSGYHLRFMGWSEFLGCRLGAGTAFEGDWGRSSLGAAVPGGFECRTLENVQTYG